MGEKRRSVRDLSPTASLRRLIVLHVIACILTSVAVSLLPAVLLCCLAVPEAHYRVAHVIIKGG